MKRIVIVCGLIAGAIVATMMVTTVALCYKNADFEGNMFLGYATMVLAFSLIFVGVKNYRDKINNGIISFGKAFKIGLYISMIASTIYVLAWLIDYYLFVPDFMDKYAAFVLKEAKADGLSASEITEKTNEMESYKEMYKSPLLVVLLTYAEIFPVGVIVSLISALILKRKKQKQVAMA